jgi:hypothetical protein
MGVLDVVPISSSRALGSWSPDHIAAKRLLHTHVGGAWDYSLVGITLMLAIVANERGWTRIAGGLAGLAIGIALVVAVRNQHRPREQRGQQATLDFPRD